MSNLDMAAEVSWEPLFRGKTFLRVNSSIRWIIVNEHPFVLAGLLASRGRLLEGHVHYTDTKMISNYYRLKSVS
jgi:hypothetical protein